MGKRIAQAGGKLATIIHPTAYIAKSVAIKSGTVIFPKAIINSKRIVSGCPQNILPESHC